MGIGERNFLSVPLFAKKRRSIFSLFSKISEIWDPKFPNRLPTDFSGDDFSDQDGVDGR